tara:strand:- start:1431 stop:2195 length:765 start_codon:yes stop_codon:yes gene_type:complete
MLERNYLKTLVYQVAAVTDRGQRLNRMIAPVYQEKFIEMKKLIEDLVPLSDEITQSAIEGEWELIFSSVELFRSSPFFLAIEKALNNKAKSDLFFKLHLLQVGSFGLSTIGRVGQYLNFNKEEIISTFDTTIFGLTTIPIIGWFKLFPTFGGRVITFAKELQLKDNKLSMELVKTKVCELDGLRKIPFLDNILMGRWYPVKTVWKALPWNKENPTCEMTVIYVDEDLRIMRDMHDAVFIYLRPSIPLFDPAKFN